jgi:hypothetical protein
MSTRQDHKMWTMCENMRLRSEDSADEAARISRRGKYGHGTSSSRSHCDFHRVCVWDKEIRCFRSSTLSLSTNVITVEFIHRDVELKMPIYARDTADLVQCDYKHGMRQTIDAMCTITATEGRTKPARCPECDQIELVRASRRLLR